MDQEPVKSDPKAPLRIALFMAILIAVVWVGYPRLQIARLNSAAVRLIDAQRYEEALRKLDAEGAAYSGVAVLHRSRGAALIGLNRFPEAIAALEQSLKIEPDSSKAKQMLTETRAAMAENAK